MKYTYKNTSDKRLNIIGVGVVDPGKNIVSDKRLYNTNLELEKPNKKESTVKESGDKEGKKEGQENKDNK